jgi:hypothetical protein
MMMMIQSSPELTSVEMTTTIRGCSRGIALLSLQR